MIRITKKTLTDANIIELKDIEPDCWIDLIAPTQEEIEHIVNKTGISKDHIKAALDENETSRFDIEDNDILVIIRIPYELENDSKLKIKTLPIGVIITKNNIITVRLFETRIMNDFYENKIKAFYTTKKTMFLIQILFRTNFYFIKKLDKIEAETERIETKLMKSLKNEEVIQLLELQKMLIYFNTAVIANGNVLESVSKGKVVKLYEEDEDILDDIIAENNQCLDMIINYSNILSNTLDAYASVVSNNLNVVMKFLASLTIILSIPAIITSFYGMNVGLPFQESPIAFIYTLLISSFFCMIIALVFIKKKWL